MDKIEAPREVTRGSYDCIVIGTGGIGSAAIYHLAARGAKVLGIDRFPVAHDKGSSHGDTRAIRLVYFEHPDYVPLLRRAFTLWEDLDGRTDIPLFRKTGILQAGPPNGEVIKGLLAAARAHSLPMEQLSPDDVTTRFPGFRADAEDAVIFDPNGGVLRVEDCIRTHVSLAEKLGATLSTGEAARDWTIRDGEAVVVTDRGRYTARNLVIAPGAWAPELLPSLAPYLHLLRKSLFWFETSGTDYRIEAGNPVFLFEHGDDTFYGFPVMDNKGIKVANHAGGRRLASPADLDRDLDSEELAAAGRMLRRNLPLANERLNHHTTCMYTMTRDGHFMVGRYPGMSNVSLVAGLSGHGFKFASVLGEIMADLALEGTTAHPIDFLSPDRFSKDPDL